MRAIPRLILVLAIGCAFGQCSTNQPYPEDWSPPVVVREGECADISGEFSNACSSDNLYEENCLDTGGLAGLLFAKDADSFTSKLRQVDRVVVRQPSSSQLLVEAWQGKELLREEEIHVGAEDCTEKGLLIRSGGKGTQIEGGLGVGSSRAVLSKNEDGDLIARLKVSFTGVWFIVPVSGSDYSWRRFERFSNRETETIP